MSKTFTQFNETDTLQSVIIGRWEGYRRVEAYTEIVNEEQRKGLPTEQELEPEFVAFRAALEKHGVEVSIPHYIGKFVYDQLTPRDIAVVIGEKLVLCNMINTSRKYECAGIFPLLEGFAGEEPDILIPPPDCRLEGGDIMVDKGRILIGISQRSNLAGYEWLKREFGHQFEVAALHTKSLAEDENVLHLDCTFNPIGEGLALIYEEGFKAIPDFLKQDYEWIPVTKFEQQELATNVLSIDQKTIIARDHPQCKRLTRILREKGFTVEEVPFDGAPSTGGSFRCCSMPLIRLRR